MASSYFYNVDEVKAGFKTAYLQKAVPLDVVPAASGKMHVGDVFSLSGNVPTPLSYTSSYAASSSGYADAAVAAAKALVSEGQWIVAQGDMTMGYGHVPVENRDYRYNDEVVLESSVAKKIMAYHIYDTRDLELVANATVSYHD